MFVGRRLRPIRKRGGAGGGAGYRYWRLNITQNHGRYDTLCMGEIELREMPGGADVTTGMTAGQLASSSQQGGDANWRLVLIDDSLAQNWAFAYGEVTGWISFDFGAGNSKDIQQVLISRDSFSQGHTAGLPKVIQVQRSDDGLAWTTSWTINDPGAGYGAGETRTFTKP